MTGTVEANANGVGNADELQSVYQIALEVLGCNYVVVCEDPVARQAIERCYSSFVVSTEDHVTTAKPFLITRSDQGWNLHFSDLIVDCPSLSDLIYDFEKALTIDAQLQRPDLLFIHGAALAVDGRCVVIAGASGAGKSSLCWSLCNAGFDYLSDELAPIDPVDNGVTPYPHAICLKSVAHLSEPVPHGAVNGGNTIHLPATELPTEIRSEPAQLAALVFVEDEQAPTAEQLLVHIGGGEATANLYVNALNQLAHDRAGLGAAAMIASRVPCYRLRRSTPEQMVNAVKTAASGEQLAA